MSYCIDIWPSPEAVTRTIKYSIVSYYNGPDGPQHIQYLTSAQFATPLSARWEIKKWIRALGGVE